MFLGTGGTPYISHKIMAQKPSFHVLAPLKPPLGGASYYARRFPKPRPSSFVRIILKLHLQAFWQNFEY